MKERWVGLVIVYSDQGSTYAAADDQQRPKDNTLLCSTSRKGERLNYMVAESFFGTLKTKLVNVEDYQTKKEPQRSLFEYIETFNNRRRRHSYLGHIQSNRV